MFVLARHGDAGKKKLWVGADTERPLSATGHQQAVGLAENLVMLKAPRLIASPYLRCHQTLEPLARRRSCMIETDARLAPGARASNLDVLLSGDGYDNAVLCTHGETIMLILARWKQFNLVSVPVKRSEISKDVTAKGGAWIVLDDGDGWTAHYLRTLHVGPVITSG